MKYQREREGVCHLITLQTTDLEITVLSDLISVCAYYPVLWGLIGTSHSLFLPVTCWPPTHPDSQGPLGFYCEMMSSLRSGGHLILYKSSTLH